VRETAAKHVAAPLLSHARLTRTLPPPVRLPSPSVAVTVVCKSRTVTVTGPKRKGEKEAPTLTRAFKSVDFSIEMRGSRSVRFGEEGARARAPPGRLAMRAPRRRRYGRQALPRQPCGCCLFFFAARGWLGSFAARSRGWPRRRLHRRAPPLVPPRLASVAAPAPAQMKVDMWFGNRKQKACLRTVCTHIKNMMTGVTSVRGRFQHGAWEACHARAGCGSLCRRRLWRRIRPVARPPLLRPVLPPPSPLALSGRALRTRCGTRTTTSRLT
jgi:hypothetical protein